MAEWKQQRHNHDCTLQAVRDVDRSIPWDLREDGSHLDDDDNIDEG
jgi:hypothetical protein